MTPEPTSNVASRIFHAAWMSILLGLSIEIALLVTAASFGKADRLSPFIADLAGKMSWSVLVCVGIAIGSAATGARGPVMGLLGFLSAPAGFAVAKAAHKSAAQALDVAISAPTSGPSPGQFIVIRAIEYAVLGLAVGYISRRPSGRLPIYVALGLAMGVAAAGVILLITVRTAATPPSTFALVSKAVNEVLFPVGCSIVLYAVNALGRRARLAVAV